MIVVARIAIVVEGVARLAIIEGLPGLRLFLRCILLVNSLISESLVQNIIKYAEITNIALNNVPNK